MKRKLSEEPGSSAATPPKRTRSNVSCVNSSHYRCFFCHLDLGSEYHQATTLELDQRVRQSAEFLEDTTLLAQLSTGNMVTIEAKYHNRCLVSLYNQVRAKKRHEKQSQSKADVTAAIVLTELVSYTEESTGEEDVAPVFKFAELTKMYTTRMKQFGVDTDQRVHTTMLKERILAQI